MSWAWVHRSIGKTRCEQVVVDAPSRRRSAGVSDDVAQVSITSGSPMKPPGLPRWSSVVAARGVGRRVDRQLGLARQQRVVVVGLALVVERVPDRERDAEEALARDQPVAVEPGDPVVVAVLHVRREPGDLGAVLEHLGAQRRRRGRRCGCTTGGWRRSRAACRPSRRSSPSAWSASARRRGRRSRAASRPSPRGRENTVLPASPSYAAAARLAASHSGRLAGQPAVAADHGADRQVQLAPPGDVGEVAEGAAHRDAGALVHLGQRVGEHRDLDAEDRAR